jgi:uncharacterized protein YggL (DUF469 family)
MKKRLRKKLHKGEFQELGFNLDFDYTGDYENNEEKLYQFFERFDEFLDSIGMESAGGIGDHFSVFVYHIGRGTVTADQRQAVIDWLAGQPEAANIVASPLRDAWYGWDKE